MWVVPFLLDDDVTEDSPTLRFPIHILLTNVSTYHTSLYSESRGIYKQTLSMAFIVINLRTGGMHSYHWSVRILCANHGSSCFTYHVVGIKKQRDVANFGTRKGVIQNGNEVQDKITRQINSENFWFFIKFENTILSERLNKNLILPTFCMRSKRGILLRG